MHRSLSNFRRFSLRSLFAAGAVASLGLPLGREACGIGGSAIQPTYTPRESVGAAPSVSLISSGASAPSAASVAASGTSGASETSSQGGSGGGAARHVSSDDEGHGTTKKRRKRKAQEESGGGTRVAGGTTYEAKEGKEAPPAPIIKPAPKPLITLSTGFESRYIYHGVDIVGFNSGLSPQTESDLLNNFLATNDPALVGIVTPHNVTGFNKAAGQPTSNATSPILYINGSIEFKGFHLGVGFIHAIDETIPARVQIANEAVTFNRIFNALGFNAPISSYNHTRQYYKEVDINADYTLGIVANILDATVGYNSYIIPDHDFKGTNYQGEAFGRLTYKQIPYIQPSITYYRYISDARAEGLSLNESQTEFIEQKRGEYLNGNYVEARLDGAITLYNSPGFAVGFAPYALVSLNDGYLTKQVNNSTTTEFNTFETGLKIPLTVGGQFSITPYLNYGFDISRDHDANNFRGSLPPFKEDVWAGVTFSYRF